MSNKGRTRNVTAKSVIHSKVFGIGFKEGLQEKPLNHRVDWNTDQQWNYERGRQFAYYCKAIGQPTMKLKINKQVSWAAIDHLSDAIRTRAII
jgi:hypothetical protein